MRSVRRWAAAVTAGLLAASPISASAAPDPAGQQPPTTPQAVLLTNDGTLPAQGSVAVVTAAPVPVPADVPSPADAAPTTAPAPEPATPPTLAELLGATVVVDLGPAVPVGLAAPPIPAEYLTDAAGQPGLTVQQDGTADRTGTAQESHVGSSVVSVPAGVQAVRMTGRLVAPADGHYELTVSASGAGRLVAGDQEVVVPAPTPEDAAGPPAAPEPESLAAGAPEQPATPVPPTLATATLGLDLHAGEVLDLVAENVDPDGGGLLALGWHVPDEVVTGPVARAVEAAASADTVVVAAPEPTPAAPAAALPVDLTDLVRRVVEANPRTAVVLDVRTDATLADWVTLPGAVLHRPVGAVDPVTTAALLRGEQEPRGRLTEAVGPADHPVFDAGHGLAYWQFALVSAHAEHAGPPDHVGTTAAGAAAPSRAAVTVEVAATGTAPGAADVEVLASRAGSTEQVPVGHATAEPAPGTSTSVVVEVDLTTLQPDRPETWPITLHVRTAGSAEAVTAMLEAPEPAAEPVDLEPAAPEPAPVTGDRQAPVEEPAAPVARPVTTGSTVGTGASPVPASGGLSMSIADGGAHLDGASRHGRYLQLTGSLPEVTVTDARGGPRPGWSVVAQASALTGDNGSLAPAALGWTPAVGATPAPAVTAGPRVPSELSGGPGLGAAALLGSAGRGSDPGTTRFGAELVLQVPTDTAPGSYAGTLTITLFPSE